MIDKQKLKEILKELAKPKKHEAGFVDARRIVSDGLNIIGLDATDILGFAKEANETRTRRVKGAHAWFKKMYEDGWRFAGGFEYEGLLYNGFIVMERELPNKRLEELIETLTDEEVIRTASALEIDRGPELPAPFQIKVEPLNSTNATEKEELDERLKEAMSEKSIPYVPLNVVKKIKEPKEGFENDIVDLIQNYQNKIPTDEEQYFEDTGKNAVWRGKLTKAFMKWKENRAINYGN